jgi:predicted nucleic acid-binding protein
VTVLDTSGAIDFLLGDGAAPEVEALFVREGTVAAPDLLVFEVLAVLRRDVRRGVVTAERAHGALDDLGDLAIDLYPTLGLRRRAWQLRENVTAADGLFVALAEALEEPLATKDRALAAAARLHAGIATVELTGRPARE